MKLDIGFGGKSIFLKIVITDFFVKELCKQLIRRYLIHNKLQLFSNKQKNH